MNTKTVCQQQAKQSKIKRINNKHNGGQTIKVVRTPKIGGQPTKWKTQDMSL